MSLRLLIIASFGLAVAAGCGGTAHAPPAQRPAATARTVTVPPPRATFRAVASQPSSLPAVTPAPAGSITELPTFTFFDDKHGWFADGGRVLATADGGRSWQARTAPASDVLWLNFISPLDGWAATTSGLFRTSDGGSSWRRDPNAGNSVARVDFIDAEHGWIGMTSGALRATVDGGLTWTSGTAPCYPEFPPRPAYAGLFDFVDARDGWSLCNAPVPGAGMRGRTLYRTADGGRNWTLIAQGDLPTGSLGPTPTTNTLPTSRGSSDLFMLNDQTGWIGDNVGVFRTDDGGKTWRYVEGAQQTAAEEAATWRGPWAAFPRYAWIDVRAVVFLTATRGFALREQWDNPDYRFAHDIPVLYETSDGGKTWTQVQCGFGSPCSLSTSTPAPAR